MFRQLRLYTRNSEVQLSGSESRNVSPHSLLCSDARSRFGSIRIGPFAESRAAPGFLHRRHSPYLSSWLLAFL